MQANTFLRSPVIFFISQLLILAGMGLFFSFVFMGIAFLLCGPLFGISPFTDVGALNDYTNPVTVRALKFIQILGVTGMFLVPALLFPRSMSRDPKEFLQIRPPSTLRHLGLAVVILMVSTPLVSWLVYFNENVHFPESLAGLEARLKAAEDAAAQLTKIFMAASTPMDFLLNTLVLAILPAVAEELMFRGALLNLVRASFRSVHVAVIVSAFVFSAFHGQFYGFVPRMVLGMLLGYIFVYSGSIWPGIAVHFLNNMLALLATWNHWEDSGYEFMKADHLFPAWIILISTVLTCAAVWYMAKLPRKYEDA